MNRALTSLITMGIGAAAFGMMQRTNVMSGRNMKKMRKRITKAIF
ncbi:YrzQ family protein [Fredinandcohnia humi]